MRRPIPAIILIILACACNPTKYVPPGETLLDKNHVIISNDGIKKGDVIPYIKQKPNKKIFGTRFHLGLYNLSNIEKDKWPHTWLRNIGEEPVIYDPYATERSTNDIQSFVSSKGYFDSRVIDSVKTEKRKSEVFYSVNLKSPYTIRNLYYEIADASIMNLFYFDSVNCMIERGKPFDIDVLQAERQRFEKFIKDRGYYAFSGDYINFRVDSTIGNRQVNIYYEVRNFRKIDNYKRVSLVPHSTYRIKNIYIYPDFIPRDVLEGGEAYFKSLDTTEYKGYYFVSPGSGSSIKYDLIIQSLYIKPGSIYGITNVDRTRSHLLSLKAFRLVNIYFDELGDAYEPGSEELMLNCNIQLTLLSQQSFRVEVEGTNSAGNLGGALNLVYQHKNLFHGAEQFNLKLKGAYEALSEQKTKLRSSQEYGIETSLRLPKFLLPFINTEDFIKNYNPTTSLLAAYNYQNMPFYSRTMANATFGYTWNEGSYKTHIINPLQFNFVNLISIDSVFKERIASSSYLAYSYSDVMILGGNYSFIFSNQKIQKSRDYWFIRINAEAAGNFLALASNIAGLEKKEGAYHIFSQPFAQYIRADIDLRYNFIVNDVSSLVYRAFVGAGIPFGNSVAIPFEKQYFGGGANGIRAWQVRSLGPGSYANPEEVKFINQTADIKLEANIEYRFKLFWLLEGALFLDAGNIWTYRKDESRPGAQFVLKNVYKDLALGTGTGLRFDFKFVIGRLDMGMKLRDPAIEHGSKWIPFNRPYNFADDFTLVVAIGYPF